MDYDDGYFEEIVQEEELNIWECINTFYYGLLIQFSVLQNLLLWSLIGSRKQVVRQR